MSEVLSLARAARRLGVTGAWLRTEAEAGRLPCLRAGNRYLFDLDALTRALSERITAGDRRGVSDAT
jgi:excisionase family DNA binding protein